MKWIFLVLGLALSGCSAGIAQIDVSAIDPGCTRQCTFHYFACVPEPRSLRFVNPELVACREAFRVCVSTCPEKEVVEPLYGGRFPASTTERPKKFAVFISRPRSP